MTDCQRGCCLVIWMALQLDPEVELKSIGRIMLGRTCDLHGEGNPRIEQLGGLP